MIKNEGNLVVLNFDGSGDIMVVTASNENGNETIVGFIQDTPHKIGESHPVVVGENAYDLDLRCVMEFKKPESVQVVIDKLQIVKKALEKNEVPNE